MNLKFPEMPGWKTQMCWLFEPPWAFILIPYLLRSSREAASLIVGTQIMAATFQQEGGSDLSSLARNGSCFSCHVSSSIASCNLQVTPKCGPWGVPSAVETRGGGPSFQLHWYTFYKVDFYIRSCLNRFLLFKKCRAWKESSLLTFPPLFI